MMARLRGSLKARWAFLILAGLVSLSSFADPHPPTPEDIAKHIAKLQAFLDSKKTLTTDDTLKANHTLQLIIDEVLKTQPSPTYFRSIQEATFVIYCKTTDESLMDQISFQVYNAIYTRPQFHDILELAKQIRRPLPSCAAKPGSTLASPYEGIEER